MAESRLELKSGDKVGKYTILSSLGEGAIASAYLAEQQLIQRKVAIMLFDIQEINLLTAVRQAVASLALLDHPHIVKLYDADEYGETFYAVLEFIEGSSLRDMIQSKNELPVSVVLKLMICIADALDHMHSRGIVHGDVKPDNIIVSLDGTPVLVDFGLAGIVGQDAFHDQVAGTPEYMSPESWDGKRGLHSDLWALGMTLYETLTRHLPFAVTEPEEIKAVVTSQTPLDLAELHQITPEPVAHIVERCLQKDTGQRYQSASELRRAFESALVWLESTLPDVAATSLHPGNTILLDVEYQEPGIPGQYREYNIIEEVGRGNFSVVYLATDVIGKRQVALKILRRELVSAEKTLSRFRREASSLARLRHPNIVQGYNFGHYGADCFIVMEILRGFTLQSALESSFNFDILHAAVVVAQILAGLERIHAEGTIHRDIKPANVMLLPERAVIMDMGLAHVSLDEQLTQSGEIFGTPRYMAPEQARGEEVSFQSDLYAVGVILYELLTGKIPHEADSTASLLFKIALQEPDPITKYRSDLPQPLVSFLDQMLARQPAHRFQSTRSAYESLLASAGLREQDIAMLHSEMFNQLRQKLDDQAPQT